MKGGAGDLRVSSCYCAARVSDRQKLTTILHSMIRISTSNTAPPGGAWTSFISKVSPNFLKMLSYYIIHQMCVCTLWWCEIDGKGLLTYLIFEGFNVRKCFKIN